MAGTNKEYTATSTDNVSSTKGVRGGYIFVAPTGTELPTDYSTALPTAYKCLGFISEDGYVETVDSDSEDLVDMNGDLMDSPQTSRVESAQLTLAEIKAMTLKLMYGDENVTDKAGVITVKHNGNSNGTWVVVLDLLLKNNRKWRKVVPGLGAGRFDARGRRARGPRPHGQVPDRRERQHLLRLHPVHRDQRRLGGDMKEITFTVDGVDGEFVCDADELKSYKTAKQLARADEDFSLSFDVMERVFMGNDEEYIERLGGSVDRLNDLLAAALDAVGEDAKNSSASPQTSKPTEAK